MRAKVASRAGFRCEYCLIHESDAGFPREVDHVISRKHSGSSEIDNLAYACVLCNRRKGSDIAAVDPGMGEAVRLFDPRRDQWNDQFRLDGGFIEPRTESGIATVRLLRLNAPDRIAERRLRAPAPPS